MYHFHLTHRFKDLQEDPLFIFVLVFVTEDILQFCLQLLNSIQIGSSWQYFQFLGLFLSLRGVATRMTLAAHADKSDGIVRKLKIRLNLFIQIVFVCFLVYIVDTRFRFEDTRPAWAKLHSSIRWNLEEKSYPKIV